MKRRELLKLGAASAAGLLLPLSHAAWAARSSQRGPRLVVMFLRGAVDGLNVVAPYAEEAYYDYRPSIAINRPGTTDGLLDLDGHFGLHPALAPLLPLWQAKQLAFVHACGSPDPDRSHFEAQAYMETATPGISTTRSGWLNRLATALHFERAADTVAFGATQPLITRGNAPTATFPVGQGAARMQPMDRDPVQIAFDAIYDGDPRLGRVYAEAIQSRTTLLAAVNQDMENSAQGAPDPQGFSNDARRAARMMAADPSLRLVFFQLGGWDTHVNQGAGRGQLANRLKPLGQALATFQTALGPVWRETVVLVISEFGRTAHENGDRGTDHGHGNVHWLLGGAIAGGRVYGEWNGLAENALYQGRDVPVTTDFRAVIDLILEAHLGASTSARQHVLPNFQPNRKSIKGLFV
jgi:uncharacterized protein (DUF1501 family)